MKIINVTPTNFGGKFRCGDVLGACNVLEALRVTENNQLIKFYVPDESIFPSDYVLKFKNFVQKHTDYFSDVPGEHQLDVNNLNIWDYRSNIPDRVKVDNSAYIKEKKICIFPLFDAAYNFYRNWDIILLTGLIDYYSENFSDYRLIICASLNIKHIIDTVDLKSFEISYDYDENLNHVMTCEYYIGGDTGMTHLAGALTNPSKNIYYYSCRELLQVFPLHWKSHGEIRSYSEYGFTLKIDH